MPARPPLTACALGFDDDGNSTASSQRGFAAALRGAWVSACDAFTECISSATTPRSRASAFVNRATARIALATPASLRGALRDAEEALAVARALAQPSTANSAIDLLEARALSRRGTAELGLGMNAAACATLRQAIAVAGAALDACDGHDVAAAAAAGYLSSGAHATASLSATAVTAEFLAATETAVSEAELRLALAGSGSENGVSGSGGGSAAVDADADARVDIFCELEGWLQSGGELRGGLGAEFAGREKSAIFGDEKSAIFRDEIESDRSGAPPDGDPSVSTFPFLCMRQCSSDLRGVIARCDVPAETELLSIGEDFLITVERAREHPLCVRLAAAGVDRELSAAKHCYLAVFLLAARAEGAASYYAPYVDMLPERLSGTPLFWDSSELSWLAGSHVLEQVAERQRNMRNDYELINAVVDGFGDEHDFEDFAWARAMVASRNFGIVVDGVRTDALVPYADMLNHQRPRQTRWLFDSSRRAFLIVSLQPVSAGQQVFDSYGKKCNSRFLINYGFTVARNVDDDTGQCHNEIRLVVSLPPAGADPWHTEKVERLGRSGVSRSVRISTFYDCETTLDTFSFLRFALATGGASGAKGEGGAPPAVDVGSELARCPRVLDEDRVDLSKRPIAPLSRANEAAVLGALAGHARAALARYPTTLEADVAELAGAGAGGNIARGSNRYNALVLLVGEKKTAKWLERLERDVRPLLVATDAVLARAQVARLLAEAEDKQTVASEERDIARYVKTVVGPLLEAELAGGA